MKNKITIIIFLVFLNLNLHAQDFIVPLIKGASTNHSFVKLLSDSSIISVTPISYFNPRTQLNDSNEALLMRHKKNGELLYYKRLSSYEELKFTPLAFNIIDDIIYVAGNISTMDDENKYNFVLELNTCFDVIGFHFLGYVNNQNQSFIQSFSKLNDSTLITICSQSLNGDSVYSTVIASTFKFKPLWNVTYLGYKTEIALTQDKIHLWGCGYYPEQSNPVVAELKLNYVVLNNGGKVILQKTEHEYEDGYISSGNKICKASNDKFLIANKTTFEGNYTNEIVKLAPNGNTIKKITLSKINTSEFPMGLCRVNDNCFMAFGGLIKNNDVNIVECIGYVLDSNLNLIRQKSILPKYPTANLENCIGYNDGALLYGSLGFVTSPPQATLVKIDTFLNIVKKPSVALYTDSLCSSYPLPEALQFPTPDTIAFEDLNLRDHLFVGVQHLNKNNLPFIVYPNPSNGNCKLQLNTAQSGEIMAYNNLGQLVYQTKFKNSDFVSLNFPTTISGMVYLQIKLREATFSKTLIIQQD